MSTVGAPQVGDWYLRTDTRERFQVVSIDADSDSVQTQSFDGQLDSIATEDWPDLPLATAAAPEDWTGPMDDIEDDDVTEDDSPSDRGLGGAGLSEDEQ